MLPDVYICPLRRKSAPLLPQGTVKCTNGAIGTSGTYGAITKARSSVKKKDTVRYLKTFRIVSNETPASSFRPC